MNANPNPLRIIISARDPGVLDILFPENDGRVRATVRPDRVSLTVPEMLADQKKTARLFAAAHLLQEALAGIVENEHACTCPSDEGCDTQCWHAIALRALRAAEEGEQP